MKNLLFAAVLLAGLVFAASAYACDCDKGAKASAVSPAATADAPCPYAKEGNKGDCANCDKPCPYKQAKAEAEKKAAEAKTAAADVAPKVFDAPQKIGTKATCPVMGGVFTIDKDTPHSEYKGKHVYFCCPACKPKFDKEPEKYLK